MIALNVKYIRSQFIKFCLNFQWGGARLSRVRFNKKATGLLFPCGINLGFAYVYSGLPN